MLGAALVMGVGSLTYMYVFLTNFDVVIEWYDRRRACFAIAAGLRVWLVVIFWIWLLDGDVLGAYAGATVIAIFQALGMAAYGSRELKRLGV